MPYEVCALASHLGQDSSSGHYASALRDEEFWWVYNDSDEPQPFLELPAVVLENVCMLWLNCSPHGGAEIVSFPADEAPVLTRETQIQNVLKDPNTADAWFAGWTQALDLLDIKILVDHPELCHRLVKKCLCCQTWPADMNGHLAVHHRDLCLAAEPMEASCAESFWEAAPATRWCACQPYQKLRESEQDSHTCPCLRQFICLHLLLRSTQKQRAQDSTLALLIGSHFG